MSMPDIMYRTEMSEDSPRDAIEVMLFEITELYNTDILDYVINNYNLPHLLKNNINEVIENIDDIEEDDENVEYMLNEILSCIEEETGVSVRYAMWLAEKDAVIDLYEGDERDIYGYKTDNAVVLSNLGYDGVLFGYEEKPEPVECLDSDNEFVTESMIHRARKILNEMY